MKSTRRARFEKGLSFSQHRQSRPNYFLPIAIKASDKERISGES